MAKLSIRPSIRPSVHQYAVCTLLATYRSSGTGQEFILRVVSSCMLLDGCEDPDNGRTAHRSTETSEAACFWCAWFVKPALFTLCYNTTTWMDDKVLPQRPLISTLSSSSSHPCVSSPPAHASPWIAHISSGRSKQVHSSDSVHLARLPPIGAHTNSCLGRWLSSIGSCGQGSGVYIGRALRRASTA